ncbi:phenylacetate--CoA ligase family protein [Maribellus luteus]|uniref:Phenylacetate--CoA ligase family protein n=1 Tax=Maribellus luteus TaxID=2305463 RepID=A0A399T6C2_9BACT|nr:phenylacetate--CoA ligase family protein [Maribellus luteus]RIJ49711.1 phenylacetate--CoA ligase family protein [Maribellus luteus]
MSYRENKVIKHLYKLTPRILRPGGVWYLKTQSLINKTEFLSKEEIEEWQLYRLKDIVVFAWNNIPGYRELWQSHGVDPSALKQLSDIEKFPTVSKEFLRENIAVFTKKQLFMQYQTTGGSTGIPFGFYVQERNKYIERAFIDDIWKRKHQKDKNPLSVILRGKKTLKPVEFDPIEGILLSSYEIDLKNVKEYIQIIEKYHPGIFQAYPSAISQMAKIMSDNNLQINHQFDSIMLGSEPLYEFQKEIIKQVFDAPISHWYGATEKVVLAGNCEYDHRFHIFPQYGYTEILKEDNTYAQEGETGEIVGTSFWNYTTPLIRYRTMDYAEVGSGHCEKCGRNYQLLNKIEGRKQDIIIDKEGNKITLTALIFAQHFHAFGNIRQLQVVQEEMGKITLVVIPNNNFSGKDAEELIAKTTRATNNRLDVTVKQVKEIPLTSQGKLRFLDQHLDMAKYI